LRLATSMMVTAGGRRFLLRTGGTEAARQLAGSRCFAPDKLGVPKEGGGIFGNYSANLDLAISATSVMHCVTGGTRCPKGLQDCQIAGRKFGSGAIRSKLGRRTYEMCWVGANAPIPRGD
jgi:hypothetical protein